MNVTNPPSSEVATAFTILAILVSVLLIYQREHVRNAIRSRLARRELAEFLVNTSFSSSSLSKKDGERAVKKEGGPVVTGIYIHPVKSLRPVSVSQTTFDERGLVGDRRLMVVRPSYSSSGSDATHRFLTQRQAPSLATIDASIPVEFASESRLEDNMDEFDTNDDNNKDIQTKSPKTRKKKQSSGYPTEKGPLVRMFTLTSPPPLSNHYLFPTVRGYGTMLLLF